MSNIQMPTDHALNGAHFQRDGLINHDAWGPAPAPPPADPGPTVRLPQIVAYLQDKDEDRTPGFKARLKLIEEYLDECDRLRREGHADFDAKLTGILYEAQSLTKVHRFYNVYTKGYTRPHNIFPPKLISPTRLTSYDRMLPMPYPTQDKKPSVYTSLIPRRNAIWHPPFPGIRHLTACPDWESYFASTDGRNMLRWYEIFRIHENHLWNTPTRTKGDWAAIRDFKNCSNPNALNFAEIEEQSYYRCMLLEEHRIVNPPPISPLDIPSAGDDGDKAISRGWKRAMIQRCLNLVDNSENRRQNSPWRRVIFPPPYEKFKEVHYQPKALTRELPNINSSVLDKRKDRCAQSEPSPWIYWYNQYLQQANWLSSWSRQAFIQRHWKNSKQIAVPVNYTGPYLFTDKCIYDEYWLGIGKTLTLLWDIIERERVLDKELAPPGRTRFLIQTISDDILAGVQGDTPPIEVLPRIDIDTVPGRLDTFQLVDEIDITWLKFLVQPSANCALAGLSPQQPTDTLMTLFDHRIQTLFNDVISNPFKVSASLKDAAGNHGQIWTRQFIPLDPDLLCILNRGGRVCSTDQKVGFDYWVAAEIQGTNLEVPNELYQFTLEQAGKYCEALARMGRIDYLKPCHPSTFGPKGEIRWLVEGRFWRYQDRNWAGKDYGHVSIPYMDSHPEERVRWRHESKDDLAQFNKTYMDKYVNGRINRVQASSSRQVLLPKETYENNYIPEKIWKRGSYDVKSIEYRRDAPSWEDLMDYRTAMLADAGLADRTVQFFRNLAFRMGCTIRHYKWLQERTSLKSSFTRCDLRKALDTWRDNVQQGREIGARGNNLARPFKLSPPQDIILNAQPWHEKAKSEDMIEVFTIIRHGIINDLVQNRTMLYPGRETAYTDQRKFLAQTYDRANIWSWASSPIRKNHAVYRRERYFDMRRWPLNRQKGATQRKIQSREDEDPGLQPASAWHKYRIVVGPKQGGIGSLNSPLVRIGKSNPYSDFSEILKTLDMRRQKLTLRLYDDFLEDLRQVVSKNTINPSDPHWRTRIVSPGHQVVPTKTRTTEGTTYNTPAADVKLKLPVQKPIELQSLNRPGEIFIPGPAVFPMGDTLLQQVKISHDLENAIYPREEDSIVSTILGWFKSPPDRVPLLPDIDPNRIPATNPLKRKVPNAFIRTAEPDHKMPAMMDHKTKAPKRPERGTTFTPLKEEPNRPPQKDLLRTRLVSGSPDLKLGKIPHVDGDGDEDRGGDGQRSPYSPNSHRPGSDSRRLYGPSPPSPPPDPTRQSSSRTPLIKQEINALTTGVFNSSVDAVNNALNISRKERTAASLARRLKVQTKLPSHPQLDDVTYLDDESRTPDMRSPENTMTEEQRRQLRLLRQETDARAAREALTAGLPHPKIQQCIKKRDQTFPLGWEIIPTSGNRLMCGFYAIIGSMKAQFPTLPQPTLAELKRYFFEPTDRRIRAASEDAGTTNSSDFSLDQLGATLWNWGMDKGFEIQMGVLFTKDDPFVCPILSDDPDDDGRFADYLLWVHNNSTAEQAALARRREKLLGSLRGAPLSVPEVSTTTTHNHYSGVRHKSLRDSQVGAGLGWES